MAQSLPHLHDSHNGGVNLILTVLKDAFCGACLLFHLRKKKYEMSNDKITPQARRNATVFTVSFIWIWLILIRKSLCLKSSLQENLSPSSTSLLFGILVSTRAFPQARDWRVRRSSLSSKAPNTCFLFKNQRCCLTNSEKLLDEMIQTYPCRQFDLLQGELLPFIKHQQHQCLEK